MHARIFVAEGITKARLGLQTLAATANGIVLDRHRRALSISFDALQ
jgi:hypothetical protein